MKKKKKIETVRLITFDQAVISVVGGTVSRRDILENFIVANNEMMTVVGGNSLPGLQEPYLVFTVMQIAKI